MVAAHPVFTSIQRAVDALDGPERHSLFRRCDSEAGQPACAQSHEYRNPVSAPTLKHALRHT